MLRRTCRDPLGISRLLSCGAYPLATCATLSLCYGMSWGQTLSPRFRPRPLVATVVGRPCYHWLWPDGWDSVSQPMSKIKFRRQASLSLFCTGTPSPFQRNRDIISQFPRKAQGGVHIFLRMAIPNLRQSARLMPLTRLQKWRHIEREINHPVLDSKVLGMDYVRFVQILPVPCH